MSRYSTILEIGQTLQGQSQLRELATCNLEEAIRELISAFPSCFSSSIQTPEGLHSATRILLRAMRDSGDYDLDYVDDLDIILIVYFGSNQ